MLSWSTIKWLLRVEDRDEWYALEDTATPHPKVDRILVHRGCCPPHTKLIEGLQQ